MIPEWAIGVVAVIGSIASLISAVGVLSVGKKADLIHHDTNSRLSEALDKIQTLETTLWKGRIV